MNSTDKNSAAPAQARPAARQAAKARKAAANGTAAPNGKAAANGTAETPPPVRKPAAATTRKPRPKSLAGTTTRTPASKPPAASPPAKQRPAPARPAGDLSGRAAASGTSPVTGAGASPAGDSHVGFGLGAAIGGFLTIGQRLLREPQALMQALPGTVSDLARISLGSSEVKPAKSDKRFRDPTWDSNRFYRTLMQTYLYLGARADDLVGGLGLEGRAADRARFAVGLARDALAPTNSILTNPEALRRAVETRGGSLKSGVSNLFGDIRHNHAMIAQVDRTAFKVGVDLACTPGNVIYRSEVCELIQYAPQRATVYERPLLIVPPQVNKYYALDLAPGRSMCEHLLKQGFQVFAISWRNPTAAQRDWGFDTYAQETLDVIDVVREVTGSPDVNLMGGCLGGMMVAIVAALLASQDDNRVYSATAGVTLLDCDVDAQMMLFATPATIALAKQASARAGILEGWQMAEIFSWLRPNDLVWNYWVNNYLQGRQPPAFDILAWNADTTRLPARFHHQVLDIVAGNQLTRPGGLTVLGTPVDISRISCDTYVVGGRTDHITPWQGCYRTTQMVSGNSQFVMCSSGHIQTVVADPNHPRLGYFVNPESPADAEAWLAGAKRFEGSWWDHWSEWLTDRSGEIKPDPERIGSSQHPAADPAPGSYIFQ